MKCLTCKKPLLKHESINCEYCIEKGSAYTKFRTADTGDGNCDS